MTTITLSIDEETKRFELDDGPVSVHAGETVCVVLRGLGVTAAEANGTNLLENAVAEEEGASQKYPALRVRLIHPVFGDMAMYPWPGNECEWHELDTSHPGKGLVCELDLDTEQVFRVVRSGNGRELTLYVERPWPEVVPTVYGTYPLRVEDWPEATGEVRSLPEGLRYLSALGAIDALGTLSEKATLGDVIAYTNALVGALKAYRRNENV